jgi:hypothetical protein
VLIIPGINRDPQHSTPTPLVTSHSSLISTVHRPPRHFHPSFLSTWPAPHRPPAITYSSINIHHLQS